MFYWLPSGHSGARTQTGRGKDDAAISGCQTAYWWGAAFFAAGAVLSALLFRRRSQGLSLSQDPVVAPEREPAPVAAD